VGATLTALHDEADSPFEILPGVERHATLADRMLDGPLLVEPPYAWAINLAALVLLGLTAALFTARLPAGGGVFGSVVLIGLWWVATYLALFPGGTLLSFVYPAVAILLNFVAM